MSFICIFDYRLGVSINALLVGIVWFKAQRFGVEFAIMIRVNDRDMIIVEFMVIIIIIIIKFHFTGIIGF